MLSENEIIDLKEKYYRRNYVTMLIEAFFVNFAFSVFSYTTVFPVYVQNITSNSFFVALVAVIYYGCSYGSSILSCLVGLNAKSPKWTMILICGLERVGFLFIIISTYFIGNSEALALVTFFASFAVYAMSAGMASPVFSNMLGNIFHRNVGGFYGSYSLVGAAAGVISARIMKFLLDSYQFPYNYRKLFIFGMVMAVIGSLVPAIGVKEVPDEKERKRIYAKELPGIVKDVVKTNVPYRHFVLLRMILGAAEMAIPFYIVRVSQMEGITPGFVGTMTTVLLLSNMAAGKLAGYVGDRLGPLYMVRFGAISGVLAAGLAIVMPHYGFGFLLFVLVAFAQQFIQLSTSVAGIIYSRGNMIPVLVAALGIAVAPSYIIFSSLGGVMSRVFHLNVVFIIAMAVYALVMVLTFRYSRKGMR